MRKVAIGPEAAALRLRHLPGFVWLDSSAPGGRMGRYSYMSALPSATFRAYGRQWTMTPRGGPSSVRDANPWDELAAWAREVEGQPIAGLPPFQGGLVGYLGYDLGRHLETVPSRAMPEAEIADLALGLYEWVLAFDHASGEAWLIAGSRAPANRHQVEADLDTVEELLGRPAPPPGEFRLTAAVTSNMARDTYDGMVARALAHIQAGDIYQVNLSHRLESRWEGEAFALYLALRRSSPAPYAAFLDFGETKIVSASPERFLRLQGQQAETRPIKGTLPRHADPERDRAAGEALLASEKDRAENLMITDLLRNDLGRVCKVGSIAVPELFNLEGFAGVWHLVSTITGELRPGLDAIGLLRACFPGGSITGCPKIRAMQIIEELEPVRRGPYCGAVVALGCDGFLDSSIIIRTAVLHGSRLLLQAGGAIVDGSTAEAEHAETMAKAMSALRAIGGGQ